MKRKTLLRALVALGVWVGAVLLAEADIPFLSPFMGLFAGAILILFLGWLLVRGMRAFLWRVGRRLAFSYFLIGVLPIPMVVLLLALTAYLLCGFFLGHLYRDSVNDLHHDLLLAAERRLTRWSQETDEAERIRQGFVFGYYRQGRRVAGDPRTPPVWPTWLPLEENRGFDPTRAKEALSPFVALADGRPGLAAAAGDAQRGVVALFEGDLETLLRERSDVWVELYRSDDPEAESHMRVMVGSREFALKPLRTGLSRDLGGMDRFFAYRARGKGFLDRPILAWGEISEPFVALADGSQVAPYVLASLRGSPRLVHRHLFSSNAEVNAVTWALMAIITSLLMDVYMVALIMAFFLILGLSRAVNRLSRATEAVRKGDFSTRIPVRRRDQLGELQRSFNEMAANLEQLVIAAAEKEALERELTIARSLQQSLLPSDLPQLEGVEFATLFEPSAAIGGDYFDILRLDEERLAVVIADVSGHGLSSGLRMAMLKAALLILVEESKRPEEILRRLDALIRAGDRRRVFVTATLASVDFETGHLELTNAGHPPTYLLRGGAVEEILLPSSPLGGLGLSYGRRRVELETGDLVVWLSDGFIEAQDGSGEPFGYARVVEALSGGVRSAAEVRARLVAAVAQHTGGRPPDDDRTLVIMGYGVAPGSAPVSPSVE